MHCSIDIFGSRIAAWRMTGLGLVEVLVALAVGAVALLGAAAVSVVGLRSGGAALRSAAATNLAADMADRLRVNRQAGPAYAGTGPGLDAGCVTAGIACAPAELAADDWFHWLAAIESQLPRGATASITLNGSGAPADLPLAWTVEVRWPEPGQAGPARARLVLQ